MLPATITLQHQLADKDIPYLQSLLETNIPVTVLKGKSNYLCRAQFDAFMKDEESTLFPEFKKDSEGLEAKKIVKEWVAHTETGDKESLNALTPVSSSLWNKISTDEYSCGGARCKMQGDNCCFYREARKKATQLGIIITNYNLLSYHIKSLEYSSGLLPENAFFVLDEAHRLKDTIRDSLSEKISMSDIKKSFDSLFGKHGSLTQLERLRGAFEKSEQHHIDLIKTSHKNISSRMKKINNTFIEARKNIQYKQRASEINYEDFFNNDSLNAMLPKQETREEFRLLSIDFRILVGILNDAMEIFDSSETHGILERCKKEFEQKCIVAENFSFDKKNNNQVRWCKFFENNTAAVFVEYCISSLFVDEFLRDNFFNNFSHKQSAVICTSATMTYDKKFDDWIQKNGVPNTSGNYSDSTIATDIFDSPFPYKERVLLISPNDAPIPIMKNEAAYTAYLSAMLPKCLDISKGSALILCTSKKMVKTLSDNLKQAKTKKNAWNILTQEDSTTPSRLAQQFREDTHSVLIATASFWEGFDAPGDALRLLIITKLPFPHPSNLFVAEEMKYFDSTESEGNAFSRVMLPTAELKLRQGFGRLMRSQTDGGVVFITDPRFHFQNYGQQFQQSLPCNCIVDSTDNLLREMQSHLEQL